MSSPPVTCLQPCGRHWPGRGGWWLRLPWGELSQCLVLPHTARAQRRRLPRSSGDAEPEPTSGVNESEAKRVVAVALAVAQGESGLPWGQLVFPEPASKRKDYFLWDLLDKVHPS